jgi:non-specific serine/threonine protein kinase
MEHILGRLPADDLHRALALANATWLEQRHGRFDAARRHAEECLRIQRRLGGAVGIADALTRLADVARNLGHSAAAVRGASDGLAIRRVEGGSEEIALSLLVLGSALGRGGDLDAGRAHLREARDLFASIDEPSGVAYCDGWAGELALRAGDPGAAAAQLGASLRTFREMPDDWMTANLYDLLAWTAVREDDGHRALRLAGSAAALREAVGASRPPALAAALEEAVQAARRWLGPRADDVLRQGVEASLDRVTAYALREVQWRRDAGRAAELTPRELAVVPLIALGLADKQIAARLQISVRTAEYHADRIRKKLGFASRAQIAAWAVERGAARTQ